jgi:hypothetical protein
LSLAKSVRDSGWGLTKALSSANLPSDIAYTDVANVFTAQQKISLTGSDPFILFRSDVGIVNTAIEFNMTNATPVEKTFGTIFCTNTVRTAGSESSSVGVQIMRNGALLNAWTFRGDPTWRLRLFESTGTFAYDITPAAITASRTLNLPLLTGTDTFAVLAATQTFTNKTITDPSNTVNATSASSPFAIGTNLSLSATGLTGVRTFTFPDSTDTVVTLAATQTMTSKTLTSPVIAVIASNTVQIGSSNGVIISQSGLTANRTFTFPDLTDTVVTLTATQTLTNKTHSGGTITGTIAGTPTISSAWTWSTAQAFPNLTTIGTNVVISATGLTAARTFTFPDLTDTVVTLTATQSLTNKTITDASNTVNATSASSPFAIGTNLVLSAAGLTAARTFTFPDLTDTVATLAASNVFTVAQKIKVASPELTLYRTGGANLNLNFTADNLTPAEVTAGAIGAFLGVKTAGAEMGNLQFAVIKSGTTSQCLTFSASAWAFQIFESTSTFVYSIVPAAITASRTLNLPLITGTDTFAVLSLAQTLSNKTLDSTNTLSSVAISGTITGNATFSGNLTLSGTNTFTGTSNTFNTANLLINNPAATFQYTITSAAITANRTLNLPLITGTDTLAVLGLAQTFTANQTFKDTNFLLRNPADTFSATISAGAQTGNVTFTFPVTSSDTITTIAATQTLTNKTIDAATNTLKSLLQDPILKRTGYLFPSNSAGIGVFGVFRDHSVGASATATGTFDTTEGVVTQCASAASSGAVAGMVSATLGVGVGRRLFAGKIRIRCKVDATASSRFYFGVTSATALPISDTPLATTDSGVLIGWRSTDTNFQVFNNDGSAAEVVTQVAGPIAIDANYHTFEINWTASGNVNIIIDSTTTTVSSRLPATTTNLFYNAMVQTTTTTARSLFIHGAFAEFDK